MAVGARLVSAILLSVFCLLPFAFASAQQPRDGGGTGATGTAVIAGVVLTDDAAAQPVRRAIVTVSGSALATSRSAITDDAGKFAISQLPPGRFSIGVKKAAYIPGAYGAMRPGRPGTALPLTAGQRADVTLKIARAAVLAGTIRDQQGETVPGVQISALKIPGSGDITNLFGTGDSVATDDRGAYRIFGLLPGEYVIAAVPRVTGSGEIGNRSAADMDATLLALQQRAGRGGNALPGSPANRPTPPPPPSSHGYAPTYFPGGTTFSGSTRIRLGPGDERTGMDFVVAPVRTTTIEGAVTGAGDSPTAVQLAIQIDGPRVTGLFSSFPVLSQRPDATNQFKYTNVAPGHYKIMARLARNEPPPPGGRAGVSGGSTTVTRPPNAPDTLYAIAEVDVAGTDVSGVILSLQPGANVSGRLVFNSDSRKPPEDLGRIRVTISPPGGTYMSSSNNTVIGNTFNSVSPAAVRPDATFGATGIAPGTYVLRVALPADLGQTWALESAVLKGQELLDSPLEIDFMRDLSDVVITFSDRRTELSGSLQTSTGGPAPEYFVVVFSSNPSHWTAQSRRMKMTRPGTDGRFNFADLPPGDYLIAALTDVAPDEWQTPAFLEQVVSGAIKISIAPGAHLTQDLRVVR